MDGVFKGWTPGKQFGFIAPDDGSADIFLYQTKALTLQQLQAGSRVSFDIEEKDKGRSVTSITAITPPQRKQGRVTYWNDRGHGFISSDDGNSSVRVSIGALSPSEAGYLCEGYVVEFSLYNVNKIPTASDVVVVGWTAPSDPLSAFADMGAIGWLDALKNLAEKEPWENSHGPSSEPLPILRNYLRYTFQRLTEMSGGIVVSTDEKSAVFNTGLVTENQEDIYAIFHINRRPGRQPWHFSGFKKASDWDFVDNFGASAPPLANYFDDPSVLLYDRRCELFINIDHVMEHIARFPEHLQKNQYVARQLMISAEATTKKRVYRNYKTAVPQYYRDRGANGGVQLLLPLCLENPARADLALVVAKNEAGNAYRGSTVLTLDMAYNNARLLARPDTEWLQP